MAAAERKHVLGTRAVGDEADVVAHIVAAQVRCVGADLAEHFLSIDFSRQLALADRGVDPHLIELAALLGRMDGRHPERARNAGAAARRARVPHVFIGVALQVQAQADVLVEALAVLGQQGVRLVAGARLASIRAAIVIHIAPGHAQHQGVIGVRALHQQRARHTFIHAGEARADATAKLVCGGEARLGRDQIDHAADGAAAVQHRPRPLHHLHPLEQAEIHEGGDRALRLRGVEAQAVNHHHHAFLLQSAQHRVLPPGAIGLHRQPRL